MIAGEREDMRSLLQHRISQLDTERRHRLVASLRARAAATEPKNPWFLRPNPDPTPSLRLFCFSYAGSGASTFRGWPSGLPAGVEICAVQLPGREWRVHEQAYRRIDALLADVAQAIAPLTDVPFAFFGHSMGALVAYELTRLLRRTARALPTQLFLSAYRAAHLPNPNSRIYHLPDEILKTVLLTEGTPAEVLSSDELMRAMLPTLRADLELCDTHAHRREAPLSLPMHIFGGLQDVRVGQDHLEPWAELTAGSFDLTMIPGSHLFIHGSENLLLRAVSSHLTTQRLHQEKVL